MAKHHRHACYRPILLQNSDLRLGTHDYLYLAIRAFGRLGSPLAQMQAAPAALAA
jgi:hypothetical protein